MPRSSSSSMASSKKRSRTPNDHHLHMKKHKIQRYTNSTLYSSFMYLFKGNWSWTRRTPNLGVSIIDCKVAGRAIAWCYDLFTDINKVINTIMLSKEAEKGNGSNSEDEAVQDHRNEYLSHLQVHLTHTVLLSNCYIPQICQHTDTI